MSLSENCKTKATLSHQTCEENMLKLCTCLCNCTLTRKVGGIHS